jgi:hypothetical protein
MQPSTIRSHLIHTNDTCPYPIQIESHSSIMTQIRVLSDSQTLHLAKANSQWIRHVTPVAAQNDKKLLTPLIFSSFGNKHQKSEKRRKKSTNSLLLDILPVNVVTSTSSTSTSNHASTRSSPYDTVVVVVGVDASTSLTVSSGGEASRTSGTPRLGPPLVPTESLLPVN